VIEILSMIVQWGHHAGATLDGLAAPSPTPTGTPTVNLNTNGTITWISTRIAPILLAGLGIVFLGRANKGEVSKVLTSSAVAFIGVAFIAGAGALFFFGGSLINVVFGGE